MLILIMLATVVAIELTIAYLQADLGVYTHKLP